ncbi:MAG: SPOR domain-containing protein, partial [Bryobacteraceae bacterium]|nr:SPOR domain-containing protein [Bryobacteraceae bacterium]
SPPTVIEPETVPQISEERRDTGRRNGTVLLAMLGIAVLSLIVWFVRRPKPATPPAGPAAAATVQPQTNTQQVPIPKRSADPAAVKTEGQWAVIAATYGDYGAALKRATQLASKSKRLQPFVLPPPGQGKLYYVVLGTAESRREAEKLRSQARSAGMPGDTYVTRLQF